MKEPMMGRSRRIIGLGYLQVTHIKGDAIRRVELVTDLLLPHRVHQPSHILMQSLFVAHLCLHPLVVFGEGQIRGCFCQLKAVQARGHFLLVSSVTKIRS